jgi:hypothetical protein
MDNTRTVTDAKQQKIKKDIITSSMSTIVDRTCYVLLKRPHLHIPLNGYSMALFPRGKGAMV